MAYSFKEGKCHVFSTENKEIIGETTYSYNGNRIAMLIIDALKNTIDSEVAAIIPELKNNLNNYLIDKVKLYEEQILADGDDLNVVDDTVYGSYIKTTDSVMLTNYEHQFCFDNINSIYYLLSNSSLVTQSIMVANTQEKYYDMLRSQIINQTEKTNEINILQDLIGDKAANDFSYFLSNFINFMLIIQTKKPDYCWKYRNWNYCYNLLRRIEG